MVLTTRSFASVQIPPETYQTNGPALLGRVSCHMMVELMTQIGQVSEFAADIFGGLFQEAKQTNERIANLCTRVENIENLLPALDTTFATSDPSVFYTTSTEANWKRQDVMTDRIFSVENRPAPIEKIRKQAFIPPNVGLLNHLATDDCRKTYSNPDFFFNQWLAEKEKEILREKESKSARKKKKKKAEAAPKMQVTAIEVKKFSSHGAEFGSSSTQSIVGSSTGAQQAQNVLLQQKQQQSQQNQQQFQASASAVDSVPTPLASPTRPSPQPLSPPPSAPSRPSAPIAAPSHQPAPPSVPMTPVSHIQPPMPQDTYDFPAPPMPDSSMFAPPPPSMNSYHSTGYDSYHDSGMTMPPPPAQPQSNYMSMPPPPQHGGYETNSHVDSTPSHYEMPPQAETLATQDSLYINEDVAFDYGTTYHAPVSNDAPKLDEIFSSVQQSRPAPPPPAPMMAVGGGSDTSSAPPARPNPFGGGGRGGLLSAIQGGAKLKKVEVDDQPKKPVGGGGAPGGLLSAIQGGAKLRKVEVSATKPEPVKPSGPTAGLGAVMDILARRKAIQESSSDDDDDDDDWD